MKIKLTESQIQSILTESVPQLLNEVAWVKTTINHIKDDFIPLTPSIVKLLTGDNKKINVFHVSDVENIDNMYNVINKRNTISSFLYFSQNNLQSLRGIKTDGGIIYHVTGNLVFQSTTDIFSVVDNSLNRRWVKTSLLSNNLQKEINDNLILVDKSSDDEYGYIKKFYKILLNGIEKYKDEIRTNLVEMLINDPKWGDWNELLVSNIKINDILWCPDSVSRSLFAYEEEKSLKLIEEVGVKLNKLAPGNVYLKEKNDEITQWFKDRGGFDDIKDYISGNIEKISSNNDEENIDRLHKLGQDTPIPGKGYTDKKGKQGLWKHKNSEITYKDDLKNGPYKEFNEDGEVIFTATYINGSMMMNKNGLEIGYRNGIKRFQTMYKDDEKNGLNIEYYNNGNKKSEVMYKDDLKYGPYKEFNEDGEVIFTSTYDNGVEENRNGLKISYNYHGNKQYEIRFKDDMINGLRIEYHPNGNKESESMYKDNKLNGLKIWYHPNGNKQYESMYKDNKMNGLMVKYDKDGNKLSETMYKDGKMNGLDIEYDKDGNKKSETMYKDGVKIG